jgi:hypothetical protein
VPSGVEARVLTNGKLLDARTFPTDDALKWAEEERIRYLAKGWTPERPCSR